MKAPQLSCQGNFMQSVDIIKYFNYIIVRLWCPFPFHLITFTGDFSFVLIYLIVAGALLNVKELQKKSELWKFTQKLEVSHVTN